MRDKDGDAMKWAVTENNGHIDIKEIPVLGITELRGNIIKACENGKRTVAFFGDKAAPYTTLYTVMADDEESKLLVASAIFKGECSYPSITAEIPALHMFEREFHEETGIVPENHPWLKPVRYPADRADRAQKMEDHPFYTINGEEIHQIAVGPIHAGVIEPGHFRFMCSGETVRHLEIQLGYQHRGVERLIKERGMPGSIHLAESAAGDTVIGHAWAYAALAETLSGTAISARAESIRAIALELERAAIHIGDLGAIAGDAAYSLGSSVFGAVRTLVINSMLKICGNRFGRGLIREGGVAFDITPALNREITETIKKVRGDVELTAETMFASSSTLSRLEHTGTVENPAARAMGMTGLAARASGIKADIRSDHPHGIYRHYHVHKKAMDSGDVFARTYMRYAEIRQSLAFVIEQLEHMAGGAPLCRPLPPLKENSFAISMTEGWRGEIVHAALTDKDGRLSRYKIKDPSFNNWYALAYALRGNGISDFPLCNKSFDLSYSGNDL